MPKDKTRITILAITSRGYVQPLIALGVGLKKAGYEVNIAAHHQNKAWIESYGLGYSPVHLDYKALLRKEGQTWLKSGDNPLKALKSWVNLLRVGISQVDELLDDCLDASQGTDAIINAPLIPGYHIAEKLHIPCFLFMPYPLYPTKEFPSPEIPFRGNLRAFNKTTYTLYEQATWLIARPVVNRWRKSLNLPLIRFETVFRFLRRQKPPWLSEYSSHVLSRPRDWPSNVYVTGYWFLENPTGWEPPDRLVDFLNSGPPPVCIGFGSIPDRDTAAKIVDISLEALKRTGQRGIFLPGWSGLEDADLPETIFQIHSVPHAWLFPQAKAIVHHGGSGTTGVALRSGVPSVAIPFFADQFLWGKQLQRIGAGPAPIPRKQLTVDTLSNAIMTMISDNSLIANAREIGEKIEAEDGITNAVNIVAQHLGGR